MEWEWGGMCENGVKNLTNYYYELDMLIHRKPQLYRFPFDYIQFTSNFHKAMLIGLGVASTNRTDKFWHTGSAGEYSSEEFDG